jgi:membrane-associated phospholipid phosphatase
MTLAPRKLLAAFALVLVLIPICVLFVDAPIARYVETLPWARTLRDEPVHVPVLVAIAAGVFLLSSGAAYFGRSPSRITEAAALSALSLGWSVCVTELLLKPLFGRSTPADLIANGQFAFDWLHGSPLSSFPSGHATQIYSVISVFWVFYPRSRRLCAGFAIALSIALVLGNWHFVSDVLAGAIVGVLGGTLVTTFWQWHANVGHTGIR